MLDKKEYKTLNLGGNAAYIEENHGTVNIYHPKHSLSQEELLFNINNASVDLSTYDNKFEGKIHIERKETIELHNWITKKNESDKSKIALLVGNAGYGKSVVLKDLLDLLNKNGTPTLGIKVDKIFNIGSLKDIEAELNLREDILSIFRHLSETNPLLVLLIDQIDALSQSLSSSRHAINSYDRLIKQLDVFPNIRIIISCRTYDLNYDPVLRAYKGKEIFRLSLLEHEQVEQVLSAVGIEINKTNNRLKDFLRIPLHLNLFCRVGVNNQFDDNITLQKLYDEIWEDCIISNNASKSIKVIELLSNIANKMFYQQHIVVDKREFCTYNQELQYLLHHNLLEESNINKIQFIHQTFFDYVYARTFVSSGRSVSNWLKNIHQGLFIRSQVRQIFSYLRDLEISLYISELKEILLNQDYRFHIKLLLINNLGFYSNPQIQEKKLVEECIINKPLYFQIFLESIQSPEWFQYIIGQDKFKKSLSKNNVEIENVIISLCIRIIWQNTQIVIDFLSDYPNKIKIIENVLIQVPESEVSLTYALYKKTSSNWSVNVRNEYYYLEKVLKSDPDFVIIELKKIFNENIAKIDRFHDNYILGGHSGFRIYQDLYEQYPYKAISYFLYVIEEIAKFKQDRALYGLHGDMAFYLYRPNPDNKKCHKYKNIYDIVLYTIKNKLLDIDSIGLILNSLESRYANILAIGIYYLLRNVETEMDRIFMLFTTNNFFIAINSSEILEYYAKELLARSYPFLSKEQQNEVNQSLFLTNKNYRHWTFKIDYTQKKVHSNYLKNIYSLISLIPEEYRNRHSEIKKIYQEGFRKYGKVKNEKPQIITIHSGFRPYSHKAYERMSFNDWKKTFIKLNIEPPSFDDWDKPTIEGNIRGFKEYVSKNPKKYYPFIISLIEDQDIILEYVIAGLEGLQEGGYDKGAFQDMCLDIINQRKKELNDSNLGGFLRGLRYIIRDNPHLNKMIFNFIRDVVYGYPDREFNVNVIKIEDVGLEAINVGINSIRGTAVELIVDCYLLTQYKEEIFEILEFVADNTNESTRACAIYRGAWLNCLDKKRAFDLYLRLVKDFNPFLLAIPSCDGHPLWYHMNVDFKRLETFFCKAITVREAGKPMAYFLFNAYLNGRYKAFILLKTLLYNNTHSRQELVGFICTHILDNEKHANKGWKIIMFLLDFDDEELGKKIDNCFLHIPSEMDYRLIKFLNKYLKSSLNKYKDNYFYDFLRDLISFDATQCLMWFFDSRPDNLKHDFYDESPLNILIEAYNGIREYEKQNLLLEQTMDTFDSLLQISQYRNIHLRTFLKELTV